MLTWLIPLCLGAIGVLQAALNKEMSGKLGVATMTLIGSAVTLFFAAIFYFVVKMSPNIFPAFFVQNGSLSDVKWWYFIPGLFGMLFVAGLPFGFYKMGAANFITGLIASQMVASVLWDLSVDSVPLTKMKVIGMLLALSSVFVLNWSKS